MPSKTRYHVYVKTGARGEILGPFGRREKAERALQEVATEHGVSHAHLVAEARMADGEVGHQVLRVFLNGLEVSAGAPRELVRPTEATPTEAAPDEAGLEPLGVRLTGLGAPIDVVSHNVVDYEPGRFSAWPANNGAQAWQWGEEILVGYFNAVYEEKEGHNWAPPTRFMLARSTDGGETWTSTESSFGGPGPAPGSIDFAHPDFALRIRDGDKAFYISYDRGQTWAGPYGFGTLLKDSPVAGDEFTSRTDYIVSSSDQVFFFMSSRREIIFTEDYVYMAKTDDGGDSFDFVSFMDPFDIDRNVMPSTVRINDRMLVSCTRRKDRNSHWIECYRSNNNGATWSSLAQVDSTGERNGNPPALVRLANGNLVCVYGVREPRGTSRMSVKVSADNGRTWSLECRLREDFVGPDSFGDVDLGYPRAFVRPDGKVVTVYYWATADRPEQYIAATIFEVRPNPPVGIGLWERGLGHEAQPGANRLLVFTLHYVENGSRFKDPRAVRYGGQAMTKLLERDQKEKGKRTYIAVFYLTENGIRQAADHQFTIDWDPNRPDNWESASVFLANVDQEDPFGDKDTGATKVGRRVACHQFRSVPAGDAVVLAGTARRRGGFEVGDGFEKADEFDLTRGSGRTNGDGVVGHQSLSRASDLQARIEHSNPGTLVVAGLQVRQERMPGS